MNIKEILFWLIEFNLIVIGIMYLFKSTTEMKLIITIIGLIIISGILSLKYAYNLDYYENIRFLKQKYEIEKNRIK